MSFHNFNTDGGTASISQHITVAGDAILDLQWDEPFNLGKVQTDYNIYVFDADGNWLDPNTSPTTFNTADDNIATDQALELAEFIPNGTIIGGANVGNYQVVIGKMNNGPASHLKYIFENTLAVSERQNAPSSGGHSAATGGQGVAATYYAIPTFPEDFSSPGPVTIYFDTAGNRLRRPEIRLSPEITAADGIDTTFFPPGGADPDHTGFPNFFGTSAAAPDAAAVGALVLQAAGGSGSLRPAQLYRVMQSTATPIPLPNVRWVAGGEAGPVTLSINFDWVRFTGDFSLAVDRPKGWKVHSITFDAAPAGLTWSHEPEPLQRQQPDRRRVGISSMTRSVSPDSTQFTITFAPGTFVGGDSFDWGMSVFAPIEGSTRGRSGPLPQHEDNRDHGGRRRVHRHRGRDAEASVQQLHGPRPGECGRRDARSDELSVRAPGLMAGHPLTATLGNSPPHGGLFFCRPPHRGLAASRATVQAAELERAAGPCRRAPAGAREQPRQTLRQLRRRERLGQHRLDTGGLRLSLQVRAAVAAHQHRRQLRPQPLQLREQLGAGHVRHDGVAQHRIEPLGRGAEHPQRLLCPDAADRLVAERRQHLFGQVHQALLVVHHQHGLAVAARRLPRHRARRPAPPR